jgi:gliding motility associated protien GldN
MSMVMTGLREGSLIAYDPITDDFTKPLTYEEFMADRTRVTTRSVEDLDNPGQFIERSDTSRFSNQDVIMLRVKEDWFIDRQRGIRETRVLGLAPVIQLFDEQTGESRGFSTLFWLNYAQCREVFANVESFNRHNSAMRLTYDDVFATRRFFNSYITKMDNMQDRQLQDFLSGWKLLAESDRIRIELLNLEEDLWEY